MLLESWSKYKGLIWKDKFKGRFAQYKPGSKTVIMLEPETYMNRSGDSVQACIQFFKIPAQELIVVHDEIEVPPGECDEPDAPFRARRFQRHRDRQEGIEVENLRRDEEQQQTFRPMTALRAINGDGRAVEVGAVLNHGAYRRKAVGCGFSAG